MKTLLTIGIILAWASLAWSAPFLVCDPQTGVDSYTVVLDGSSSSSVPQDLGDGTVRLHFDLAGISDGSHHVDVSAKNIWGESASVPLDFDKLLPGVPSGIGLSSN